MSITVNFRTSQGEVTTRRFRPGDGVSIYGKVVGLALPDPPGTRVRLSINEIAYYQDVRVNNVFGDYAGYVRFPNEPGRGTLDVTVFRPLGTETVSVPISWGEIQPAPIVPPPPDSTSTISSTIKVIAVAVIALAAVYALSTVRRMT